METVPTSTDAGFLDESVNLRHYWHVILERRWLVITAFVSILVLCAIYLAKATPIYQAIVRMQIDRESANVLNIKDVFSVDAREQDYLQTQYKNLQSRTLIASVMKKLNLDQDARYAKSATRSWPSGRTSPSSRFARAVWWTSKSNIPRPSEPANCQ